MKGWRRSGRRAPRQQEPGAKAPPDWLSRALARAGVLSLAEAETAIREGRVQLSGRVVHQPLTPVRPHDRVHLDGKLVSLHARTLVVAFHKPYGSVSSTVDPHEGQTVFEQLLPTLAPELREYGWHAIGRLDRGTTGLLLFTNDEQLVAHVTAPKTKLPKRYVATVQGTPDEAKLEKLRKGISLDDGPTLPAKVRLRTPNEVEIVLHEGRNHQVKRMLGAVGLPVRRLHREAIGGVVLDVPEGASRVLSDEEVEVGLRYRRRTESSTS